MSMKISNLALPLLMKGYLTVNHKIGPFFVVLTVCMIFIQVSFSVFTFQPVATVTFHYPM